MNKYILGLLLPIFFGCSAFHRSTYIPSEKLKIANEIRKKAAIELMAQTGLQPCGSGGQMMDQVKMLALSFDYKEPLQIGEARTLLVKAVDVFLDKINSDDRIRPYLNNYPFEPKNIEIRIFLRGRDRFDVPPGDLSVISAIGGILSYDIDDPKTRLLITILNETYAEAQQVLKQKWTGYDPLPPIYNHRLPERRSRN